MPLFDMSSDGNSSSQTNSSKLEEKYMFVAN
jgi:hypothetical protein